MNVVLDAAQLMNATRVAAAIAEVASTIAVEETDVIDKSCRANDAPVPTRSWCLPNCSIAPLPTMFTALPARTTISALRTTGPIPRGRVTVAISELAPECGPR